MAILKRLEGARLTHGDLAGAGPPGLRVLPRAAGRSAPAPGRGAALCGGALVRKAHHGEGGGFFIVFQGELS